MKHLLFEISVLCTCIVGNAFGEDVTINYKVGNTTYDTTTCTVGGDISLPNAPHKNGYTFVGWMNGTPVEYLQSSGKQYISTGLLPNAISKIEIEIMPLVVSGAIFGTRFCSISLQSNTITFNGQTNNNGIFLGAPCSINQKYRIYADTTKTAAVNGQPISLNSSIMGNYTDSIMTIFARTWNSSSGTPPAQNFFTGRIYSVKMWDKTTGNLIRDYIPALDSRGVPAMYDKVTDAFYYNNGTGQFTYGPVLQ